MPKVDTLFFKKGSFYLPSALFCSTEHDSNRLNLFLTSRGNGGFRVESRCQFNCLFKEREKNKPFSLYCWIFTSASGLWQCAVECCCLIVRVCSGTGLCYDDLYCSLISSLGFPLASSPHPPILFTVQPSIILPLSEGAAKLSGTWKQLFFCVWGDTTCSSDRLFCPPLTEAQLTVRQTDFLLLPRLPRLVLKEVVMFIKNGRRYLSPRPQSDSETLISLTYRCSKGAFSPANECWKHCEADWESKSRKNITMCRFISNKSSLARLQNTGGKHPSGNQDRSPRWSWKNALHPSCFWITYFSFSFGEAQTFELSEQWFVLTL